MKEDVKHIRHGNWKTPKEYQQETDFFSSFLETLFSVISLRNFFDCSASSFFSNRSKERINKKSFDLYFPQRYFTSKLKLEEHEFLGMEKLHYMASGVCSYFS